MPSFVKPSVFVAGLSIVLIEGNGCPLSRPEAVSVS